MQHNLAVGDVLRRGRRNADLSQRQLAALAGVGHSTVARLEGTSLPPALRSLATLLAALGLRLVAVDASGAQVEPLPVALARDAAGRQYPAHLDVRVWRREGDWWWDAFSTISDQPPAYTFDRGREKRDDRREWIRLGWRNGDDWPRGWFGAWARPMPTSGSGGDPRLPGRRAGPPADERDLPPRRSFDPRRPVAQPRVDKWQA